MSLTYQELTELLTHSGVISQDDLTSIASEFSSDATVPDVRVVTAKLLRRGKITDYQSQLLLEGRSIEMGNYLILDQLGQGGMGLVYKARHKQMDRVVAMKVIRNKTSIAANERFQREIKVIAAISHPNVVTAYDAGDAAGVQYLVMEFIKGANLSQYVTQHGPLSIASAVGYLRQVAEGLKCIHDRGIVHRDIKPSNLLLDESGTIKVLDLGLSRLTDWPCDRDAETRAELTASDQVLGTVDYMAPEQFVNAKNLDRRADIYALGCTLYFLLVGKPPFTGSSMGEKVIAHREAPAPSLKQLRHDVPADLDVLFQRMVAKRPEDRLASADALIAALDTMRAFNATPASKPASKLPNAVDSSLVQPQTATLKPMPRGGTAIRLVAWCGVAAVVIAITVALNSTRPGGEGNSVGTNPVVAGPEKPPPVPDKQSTPVGPKAPINEDPQRTAARVVLARAGTIDVISEGAYPPTIKALTELPVPPFQIYRVNLSGSSVTDDDLRLLQPLAGLQLLDLAGTEVTDEGLTNIAGLKKLQTLNIGQTAISDRGLKLLDGLQNLQTMDLRGTKVTDDGLEQLAKTHSLTSLRLGEHQVTTDAGLKHLIRMQTLTSLALRDTRVTDEGMASLSELKNLTWIDLGLTRVSDRGIVYLEHLPRLEHVILQGTAVTNDGVQNLMKKCTVSR